MTASGRFRLGPGAGAPRVGGLEVLGEIARGGMGVVFRARHPRLDRLVAVKVLLQASAPGLVERFQKEARAAARLRHPAIVTIHDVGFEGQMPYLIMDLIEGPSLAHHLAEEGPMAVPDAVRVAIKVAQALEYAHGRGVVHRDVKPSNVLLAAEGPVLTDFGLARILDDDRDQGQLTRSGDFLGSPGFASPEQVMGLTKHADARSDVYSLGATLYAMLVGCAPFDGPNRAAVVAATIEGKVVPPSELAPDVDPELTRICMTCLQGDPNRRYPTARLLARDLRRHAKRGAAEGEGEGGGERRRGWWPFGR